MKRFFFTIWLVLTFGTIPTLHTGCGYLSKVEYAKQEAINQANRAIPLVEVLQTAAEVAYESEQRLAVARSLEEKTTKDEVEARVAKIRVKWAPLWAHFENLRGINLALKVLAEKDLNVSTVPEVIRLVGQLSQLERETAELFALLKGKK